MLKLRPSLELFSVPMVDHLVHALKLRGRASQPESGGGGIKVSRAIRRLGGSSVALYPVGGPPGQLLQNLQLSSLDSKPDYGSASALIHFSAYSISKSLLP